MTIKTDFKLTARYGVVDRVIFRLILHGITEGKSIANALPIFSDSVIANSLQNLTNNQLINVDVNRGLLSIADPIVALIEMCSKTRHTIADDSITAKMMEKNGTIIIEGNSKEAIKAKEALIFELLPGIKLDSYLNTLDFVVRGEPDGKAALD